MKPRIVALLPLLLLGSAVAISAQPAPPTYDVAVREGRVSVRATEGSLLGLVTELGRRLGFELIAHDVEDTAVTVDFERLTQQQAIRTLCHKIGYVEVADPVTGKTVRLVLTPTRSSMANRVAASQDPLPLFPEPKEDPFGSGSKDEEPAPPPAGDDDAGAFAP